MERLLAQDPAIGESLQHVFKQGVIPRLALAQLATNAREFYATINRIAREERLDDHVTDQRGGGSDERRRVNARLEAFEREQGHQVGLSLLMEATGGNDRLIGRPGRR